MMAKVSIQFLRSEEDTSFSKSLVMMFPTVVRNESPCSLKYSSRARVHSVVPPPEASSSASAMRPLLKQHSTAAVRLPTSRDCLMRDSGPADQFVTLSWVGVLSASSAATAAAAAAASTATRSCSVLSAKFLKKSSAPCSLRSGPRFLAAGAAEAAAFSSSGGGPIRVVPGFLPKYRSASCSMRSWSKPRSAGRRVRPASSN
mmetsp:Transcript_16914/g.59090  ORF Transcript_16914/g.59090 Transcript_16914/m.59090 type:complete len:202 (-) Transcript_16914:1461-2066(-)